MLPASSGAQAVLLDTDDLVASVGGVRFYPSGLMLTLSIRSSRPGLELYFGGPPSGPDHQPCHLYLDYPDGESATGSFLDLCDAPRGLRHLGGSGGGGRWDMEWWTWPLPDTGSLHLRIDCPTLGLTGSADLHLGDVNELAANARVL